MFSTLPKTNFYFSVTFTLLSANAFSLDQSKILFSKELRYRKSLRKKKEKYCLLLSLYFKMLFFSQLYKKYIARGTNGHVTYPVKTPFTAWFSATASSIWGNINGWLQIFLSCIIVFISILAPPFPCKYREILSVKYILQFFRQDNTLISKVYTSSRR